MAEHRMRRRIDLRRSAATGALLALLVGCAAVPPPSTPAGLPLGSTEAQVIARMGQPTGRYQLPQGGTRLEFARGPQGRETYMVDFDAKGGSILWEQVLTPQTFLSLQSGMSTEEVLMRIGHPGSTRDFPRQQLWVWNYRYPTFDCLWYQVSIGYDGKFIGAANTTDPQCDKPTRL